MFKRRPRQSCAVVGLDGAGKTTLLHCAKILNKDKRAPAPVVVLPTCGVELHTVIMSGVKWKCWDLGGQGRYRDLWQRYYSRSDAVVVVVDGNDDTRLGTLRDEFHRVVNHPDFVSRRPPLLVFVNKCADGVSVLRDEEVSRTLQLSELPPTQRIRVLHCNGVTGAGVSDGFAWLASMMTL